VCEARNLKTSFHVNCQFYQLGLINLLEVQLAVIFEWIRPASRALLASILKFSFWFGYNAMNQFQYTTIAQYPIMEKPLATGVKQ